MQAAGFFGLNHCSKSYRRSPGPLDRLSRSSRVPLCIVGGISGFSHMRNIQYIGFEIPGKLKASSPCISRQVAGIYMAFYSLGKRRITKVRKRSHLQGYFFDYCQHSNLSIIAFCTRIFIYRKLPISYPICYMF